MKDKDAVDPSKDKDGDVTDDDNGGRVDAVIDPVVDDVENVVDKVKDAGDDPAVKPGADGAEQGEDE